VFAIAAELGNVRAAGRAMGIHPSTYYRWKRQLDCHGPQILRPRERRVPRMANASSVLVEQRVVAFALGHPGFGRPRPDQGRARQAHVGRITLSTNGCGACCAATACQPGPDATAWCWLGGATGPLSGRTAARAASGDDHPGPCRHRPGRSVRLTARLALGKAPGAPQGGQQASEPLLVERNIP
jgi:hypothetical protein